MNTRKTSGSVYYNEIDPFAAAWLKALMQAGEIPSGAVDERSIELVRPDDLRGFGQCHFFAGIGGWAYALRLAGWDDRPVWTGSCPCQPFSSAGAQAGGADPRDLWPAWFQLIAQCRPQCLFSEQVEAAIAHGWYDRVCDDLEREGYAVGACSLPAASVGAFHIRQRLWFVAESDGAECEARFVQPVGAATTRPKRIKPAGISHELADAKRERQRQGRTDTSRGREGIGAEGARGGLTDFSGRCIPERSPVALITEADILRQLGDAEVSGRERRSLPTDGDATDRTQKASVWDSCDWLPCRDGKARPTQPGLFPLAHGVSNRVGTLRGAGNAIVPQVAAEFIKAYRDVSGEGGR